MTALVPFFDGHNDFLLRLMMTPAPREETWLGASGRGHLDLARMKASGFAGGLFAIFVPPASSGPPPDFKALMADPPYALPMPPEMTHTQAQPNALAMAGLLHWMERAAPGDFRVCRSVPEIRAAMEARVIAGVMHMEGAEAIGPDLDALHLFHDMGLRSLGPVWSRSTIFGHGVPMAFPGSPDTGPGLTGKGRDLVRLCDELGILAEVMRNVSSRAPSMRCVGASDEMIQLSTTDPMLEPMKPPMVAALTPRIAPPMLPPMAAPAAPRTSVAMSGSQRCGNRKAKAMRRRQACVSGSSMTPSRS